MSIILLKKSFFSASGKWLKTKDLILFFLIIFTVAVSLPVSLMGNQNLLSYIFNGQNIKNITVDKSCLESDVSCSIMLDDSVKMNINMESFVSSTKPFNIKIEFPNDDVNNIDVLFKGVEHSHGLRRQPLNKINARNYNYVGQLGYCGLGVMSWAAIFNVSLNGNIYSVSLPFKSIDPKIESLNESQLKNEIII